MIAGIIIVTVLAAGCTAAIALRGWRLPPPWNTQLRAPPRGALLVYDVNLPAQPYKVSLPADELRTRFGGLHELRQGRSSMWVCRRDGDGIVPIPLHRDPRTARTPEYLAEYMRMRPDREILTRPNDRAQRLVMMGAAVAVVITTVSGLILVMALSLGKGEPALEQNGHQPDDHLPPADESPRVPSVDDVVMQSLGERWETAREMLNYPTVLSHAIPRAVLTDKMATALLRSSMMHNLWQTNAWDPERLAWEKMALSVPIDGRGRAEAVEIATSVPHRLGQGQQGDRDPRDGPRPRR